MKSGGCSARKKHVSKQAECEEPIFMMKSGGCSARKNHVSKQAECDEPIYMTKSGSCAARKNHVSKQANQCKLLWSKQANIQVYLYIYKQTTARQKKATD